VDRPSPGRGCEDDVGDEDDGLRLWSSGTRSHPVEDINLRETMSMAVKKMSEKTKTTTEMGMAGLRWRSSCTIFHPVDERSSTGDKGCGYEE